MRQTMKERAARLFAASALIVGLGWLLAAFDARPEPVAPAPSKAKAAAWAVVAEATAVQTGVEVSLAAPSPRLKPARYQGKWAETLSSTEHAPVRDAAATKKLVHFKAGMLAEAEALDDERRCLAQAMYYEARSEKVLGQLAVADVVMNRVESRRYPSTICGVVFQGSERRSGCQFSFTCDGSMKARINKPLWRKAERLAGHVMAGLRPAVTHQATHYHATYVTPFWAASLTETVQIGDHKFYKRPPRSASLARPVRTAL